MRRKRDRYSTQIEVNMGKGSQVWHTLKHVLLLGLYRILQIPSSTPVAQISAGCMVIVNQTAFICYRHTTCCNVVGLLVQVASYFLKRHKVASALAENGFV